MDRNDPRIDEIFNRFIVPDTFQNASLSRDPVTVLLGGQPGAGKSTTNNLISQWYPDRDFVELDGDSFRQYHPDFHKLLREDPYNMPVVTAPAMGRWVTLAAQHANECGYSTVMQSTWGSARIVDSNAKAAQKADRETHAVALAVPKHLSALGAMQRFYGALAQNSEARWVGLDFHDQSFNKLAETVRGVGGSKRVDRLSIVNRDRDTLYTGATAGEDRSLEAQAALLTGQSRRLEPHELDYVIGIVPALQAAHQEFTAGQPDAEHAMQQAQQYHQDALTQRDQPRPQPDTDWASLLRVMKATRPSPDSPVPRVGASHRSGNQRRSAARRAPTATRNRPGTSR